jgi:predicted aldo/keto reductase-like oxidoreductase
MSSKRNAPASTGEMPYRELGKTGQMISCIGLGGSHIGKPKITDAKAIRLMRTALDRGMNFMDNCWDYNDGRSETIMGKALRDGYREKAFLMTKFDGRNKKDAMKQIDESLKRLKTDHVDLMQFHENIRFDDADQFFASGGAGEALLEARKAGKTRFIGFTGHKDPRIHLYMLELARKNSYQFDSVQMPVNVMDAHFRSFTKQVIPEALRAGVGILGMKPLGGGVILKSNTATAEECLRYALSQPVSVVITGIDSQEILDQAFRIAKDFQPLKQSEIATILKKTAKAAEKGEYELFKTSQHFDGTAEHPEWMGKEPKRVRELAGTS